MGRRFFILGALVVLVSCNSPAGSEDIGKPTGDTSFSDIFRSDQQSDSGSGDVHTRDLPDLQGDLQDLRVDLGTVLDLTGFDELEISVDLADHGEVCGHECLAPDPVWAISLGGEKLDHLLSLATTTDGTVYVGGKTTSEFFWVDEELQGKNSPGEPGQIFVSRILASGEGDWTRLLGGSGDDRLRGLGARANGGVLAAGLSLSETLLLGTAQFTNQGHFDAYAVALADDGQVDWALAFGGEKDEILLSIAEDDEGNALLGGYFSSQSVAIGELTVENTLDQEQYDLLIVKVSPVGTPLWARLLGSTGFDYVHSLEADAAGNVYFLGGISGSGMVAGSQTLATVGERDILTGKFSPDGTLLWVKRFGGTFHDAGHALAVSAMGDLYITGSLQSPVVDFGGAPIEHVGSEETHDIFLVRLDTDGNHVWSRGFGGVDWDLSKCLALDGEDGLYMVGAFNSPAVSLGGDYLTGAGPGASGVESFVAHYGLEGNHRWSKAYGGADDDLAYWVGVGGGTVAFAGTFNGQIEGQPIGTMDPGTGPLPVYGGRDSFVVRLK